MRTSGVLMPIFSLDSEYGIGDFGKSAYNFVDFLKKAGQTYWQILPLGITGFGDSPYQSVSAYAGNPYFIDLNQLVTDGFLKQEEIDSLFWGEDTSKINYDLVFKNRYSLFEIAFSRFKENLPEDYSDFLAENEFWLEDYALFAAVKESYNGASFNGWENDILKRKAAAVKKAKTELGERINFYKMLQYFFSKHWFALKEYANKNGIYIIGDIPIYVALDSADVWANPEQFLLDKNLKPSAVAGCPPDAFSEDGQLWGNPLYNWDYMKKNEFEWWIKRIGYNAKLYDVVRIDHFRAFSAYYSIPYGEETAIGGKWIKGAGLEFFKTAEQKLGKLNIIAEDLGTIDDDVRDLLKKTGFPGMKVLQFAFDPESESSYLPHNIVNNCVVYTGTHDNDTLIGFLKDGEPEQVEFMKKYLRISDSDSFNWSVIKSAMASPADTVIFQMQDFLGLDNTARINTPATTKNNWQWRIGGGCINDWLAKIIRDCTKTYYRAPLKKP